MLNAFPFDELSFVNLPALCFLLSALTRLEQIKLWETISEAEWAYLIVKLDYVDFELDCEGLCQLVKICLVQTVTRRYVKVVDSKLFKVTIERESFQFERPDAFDSKLLHQSGIRPLLKVFDSSVHEHKHSPVTVYFVLLQKHLVRYLLVKLATVLAESLPNLAWLLLLLDAFIHHVGCPCLVCIEDGCKTNS